MVGDRMERDIEAGRRLGMKTDYTTYGDRRFEHRTNGADFVLEEVRGLLNLLN